IRMAAPFLMRPLPAPCITPDAQAVQTQRIVEISQLRLKTRIHLVTGRYDGSPVAVALHAVFKTVGQQLITFLLLIFIFPAQHPRSGVVLNTQKLKLNPALPLIPDMVGTGVNEQ